MNDYLSTLALRALRPAETLQPRRSGMFEPSADPFGPEAIPRVPGGWESANIMAPAGPVEGAAAAPWSPEQERGAFAEPVRRQPQRIVAPPAPSSAAHGGDKHDGAPASGALQSGEMAAEDAPGRVRSQSMGPLLRSHDISMARYDSGGIGRDTGIVPQAHGTGAAAERSGRFLKLPGRPDMNVVPQPELSLIPSPPRMQPGIAAAGRENVAEREELSLHPGYREPEMAVPPVAGGAADRIAGSLRGGDRLSAEEPAWISSPAPDLPDRRLTPASVPAGADLHQTRNEPPVVRVTIGRIEVRAIMPQAPSRPDPPARKREPRLSLDEYLRSQKRGGR